MEEDLIAYILCYTIRTEKDNGKSSDKDYWEVFAEYDDVGRDPRMQAENRLSELEAIHESEDVNTELYSWNIARIVKTSEWYNYDKG